MKTISRLLLLVAASAAFASCQKTDPPSNSSTGGNNVVSTHCTNAELFLSNYEQYIYFGDTVNGHGKSSWYSTEFWHQTTQYPKWIDNSGAVTVNGDTISLGGINSTSSSNALSGTCIWRVAGCTQSGIAAGSYTSPVVPITTKAIGLDTVHLTRDYVVNLTQFNADSIFVNFKSSGDTLLIKYCRSNCPNQFVFKKQRLINITPQVSGTNGNPDLTILSITATNYNVVTSGGIIYNFRSSSSVGYYIPIVNY